MGNIITAQITVTAGRGKIIPAFRSKKEENLSIGDFPPDFIRKDILLPFFSS